MGSGPPRSKQGLGTHFILSHSFPPTSLPLCPSPAFCQFTDILLLLPLPLGNRPVKARHHHRRLGDTREQQELSVWASTPIALVGSAGEKGQQACLQGPLHPAKEARRPQKTMWPSPRLHTDQHMSDPGPRTIFLSHKDAKQRAVQDVPVPHPTV